MIFISDIWIAIQMPYIKTLLKKTKNYFVYI